MTDDVERRLADRLEAAGRGVDPSPGAWTKVRARALAEPSRRSQPKWLFAFAPATLALMIVFSAAAYASPPDGPLFPLQRGLDDTMLALPLPSDLHARAQVGVGERRTVQAGQVSSRSSADVVSDLLDEGSSHYHGARATAGTLRGDARAQIFRELARSERNAALALRLSISSASQENQELLEQHEGELNDGAHNDEQRSENDGEHEGNN
jgi:hypothetical protein